LGGPGPASQWLLPDEIRARENLDPMAVVQHDLDQQLPPGIEPDTTELQPAPAPAAPALEGGPDVGNDAFGAAGNAKGAGL